MSADEPFVIFSALMINVFGNSQQFGESFTVDVQLQNFGMVETGVMEIQLIILMLTLHLNH